tara:strand:+ start:3119 stop:3868 length:750 start_codon:yes stop_codon:yes gene_type:complete
MEKKKIVIIIQARLNSKRLPNKVLKKINNITVLEHIIYRLKKLNLPIIVATTTNPKDKKIINLCKRKKISFFSGDEKDVLKRFYNTAIKFKAQTIIRITADCPLIDYKIVKKLIKLYSKGNFDHVGVATGAGVSKIRCNKYPDGLDAECFSFSALDKAFHKAKLNFDREHVTPFLWKNKKKFNIGTLVSKKDYSHLRITLDNLDDLKLIRTIYRKIGKKNFYLKDINRFFKSNPNLLNLNKKYIGKEKY